MSADESADDALGLLVNRPPEFEDPLPMLVNFEKNSSNVQTFQYVLPKIIDIEGQSFEIKVSGLEEGFIELEGNTLIFKVGKQEGLVSVGIDLEDEFG